MKRLSLLLAAIAIAFSPTGKLKAQPTYIDKLVVTNLWLAAPNATNLMYMHWTAISPTYFAPYLEMSFDSAGVMSSSSMYAAPNHAWAFTGDMNVLGNFTVGGTFTAATNLNVVNQTNLYYTTNAFFAGIATNAITATNAADGNLIASQHWVTNNPNFVGPMTVTEGGSLVWDLNSYELVLSNSTDNVGIQFFPSLASSVILGSLGNTISPTNYSYGISILGGGANSVVVSAPHAGGTSANYSTITGGDNNAITDTQESTIGGGGYNAITTGTLGCTIGGGENNTVTAIKNGTVSGGYLNIAGAFGKFASASGPTVGGGNYNQALDDASVVSGGEHNTADGPASFVGGGGWNAVRGYGSLVAGGVYNYCYSNNASTVSFSTISGGRQNTNLGSYATIPGGYSNYVAQAALYAMAAGNGARALHQGSFVWSDTQSSGYSSTINDSWRIHAAGGFVLDGGNFQGNGIALTNQVSGPTPIANQVILWYSNSVLWATGPNNTKPVLTGL